MTGEADTTRRAVLKLLKAGECTVSEAARLADTSRQRVDFWAKMAGLDAIKLREARLARIWERMTE